MRPYVIINGVNSNTITGLIISKLPPVTKPQMRVLTEQIDGRDGDINTPLGFSAYDKPLEIGLTAEADVNEVIAYFNQAGKIIFSNEPDKYYNFAIYDAIDFEKLIRFKTATINLHTQPYKYSATQGALALNSGSNTVVNSGNTVSKPDLILEGSGVVNLSINNRQVIEADLTDVNKILIDSDTMNAYEANSLIKSLKSDINPVQDLHGYSKPWSGGGGKNKAHVTATSQTISGVAYTVATDGRVKANGTASGASILDLGTITLIGGTEYTLTGCPSGGSGSTYALFLRGSGSFAQKIDFGGGNQFTVTDTVTTTLSMIVYNGYTASNLNFEPMVRLSSTSADFEPYSNICPISGFSALNVTLADENMQTVDTASVNFGQTVYGGVCDVTNGKVNVEKVSVDLGSLTWTYSAPTATRPIARFNASIPLAEDTGVSLDILSDIYNPNNSPVADREIDSTICLLSKTIYICDSRYSDANSFKTAVTGHVAVYPLATPIEITTTPENLTAIRGVNNIFSDTNGNTEVKVKIDGEEQTFTGEIVTFNISELDYELGAFANRIVTGNYDNIKLEVGSNTVELTGAFTGGQLTKYSRWL